MGRKNSYAQTLTERRKAREDIIKMWTAQCVLDVMVGVLNDPDVMGHNAMGAKRLTKVNEAFNAKINYYMRALTADPEADYIRAKIEQQQEQIFGPNYLKWHERYEYWDEKDV